MSFTPLFLGSFSRPRVLMALLRSCLCPVLLAHRSGVNEELCKLKVNMLRDIAGAVRFVSQD